MLKTLDVLIGLSVVMLVLSMVVTLLTQSVTSALNSRGRHLLAGLADLLQQMDPALTKDFSREISAAVLTHPLIHDAGWRYGDVVHREEWVEILLELASGQGRQKLKDQTLKALTTALKANGIENPAAVLDDVRAVALRIEAARPDLAHDARMNIAWLQQASSKFLAKTHSWFDQTIDRVSARFTFSTRIVTFICAMLLVIVVQLDTVGLVNRLASDPKLRSELVQQGMKMGNAPLDNSVASREKLNALATAEILTIPGSYKDWKHNWCRPDAPPTLPGVLLSGLLLSLGAPFWYNTLKNALRLRSVVAANDDTQREVRQTAQAPPSIVVTADLPSPPDPPVSVG